MKSTGVIIGMLALTFCFAFGSVFIWADVEYKDPRIGRFGAIFLITSLLLSVGILACRCKALHWSHFDGSVVLLFDLINLFKNHCKLFTKNWKAIKQPSKFCVCHFQVASSKGWQSLKDNFLSYLLISDIMNCKTTTAVAEEHKQYYSNKLSMKPWCLLDQALNMASRGAVSCGFT